MKKTLSWNVVSSTTPGKCEFRVPGENGYSDTCKLTKRLCSKDYCPKLGTLVGKCGLTSCEHDKCGMCRNGGVINLRTVKTGTLFGVYCEGFDEAQLE